MGLPNTQPFEVLGAPFTLWIAAVGATFPNIDAAPNGSWTKVGSSGTLNYDDAGVTVTHSQAMNFFRAAGDAGSRKVFRTEEDFKIALMLADMTLEQYRLAINSNTVTTTAASMVTAGQKVIGLSRGLSVATVALLARGPSPYMDDGHAQFEVPYAVQTGNPAPVFRKGQASLLALEWTALVDPNAATEYERFGRLRAQTADALT